MRGVSGVHSKYGSQVWFKVTGNPVFSRSTNLESKLIELLVFVNF